MFWGALRVAVQRGKGSSDPAPTGAPIVVCNARKIQVILNCDLISSLKKRIYLEMY